MEHSESSQPVVIELGVEFVVDLLLFAFPYGAEQMNLPHSFWLGFGCWVVGIAVAIRMFWIFPLWTHRLSSLEKGLLAFILTSAFVMAVYRPINSAYVKRNIGVSVQATPTPPPALPFPVIPQREIQVAPAPEAHKTTAPKPQPDTPSTPSIAVMSTPSPQQTVNVDHGIGGIGGTYINPMVTNIGQPPPEPPQISWHVISSDYTKAGTYVVRVEIDQINTFNDPAFVAFCDNPCSPSGFPTPLSGGVPGGAFGNENPEEPFARLSMPSSLFDGAKLVWEIQSTNGQPITVTRVAMARVKNWAIWGQHTHSPFLQHSRLARTLLS